MTCLARDFSEPRHFTGRINQALALHVYPIQRDAVTLAPSHLRLGQTYDAADMTSSIATIRSSHNPVAATLPNLMDRWLLLGAWLDVDSCVRDQCDDAGIYDTGRWHHLFDLIVGRAIAACAIFFVRFPLRVRRDRLPANSNVGLASA